jgi:peptidoglycan/LPS O-acetylase OafA/YrhL
VQLGAWLAIVLVALDRFHIASVLDQEFISGITVVIIVGQATRINRLVNLDLRVFDFLGKISYGLYVIHPLMIFFWSKIFIVELPSTFKYIAIYSLVLGSTIVVAYLSYEHFEKYFLRLKARFSAILSSSTGQAPV